MSGVDHPGDLERARELDRNDELHPFRRRLVIDDPDCVYLDGNSLGRLPRPTAARLERVVKEEWGVRLVRAWNEGWIEEPLRLGGKLAPLIGAARDEVLVAETTSINLFKLAAAALAARPGRHKIVSDTLNFPSDLYVLEGLIRLLDRGHRLHLVEARDGISIADEDLEAAIDDDVALLTLSHVSFKSAFLYDLRAVSRFARRRGALVLWDLSHSVGAVPVDLGGAGADLAVGCTYKYLNAGPGAPAFLYVRRDLQDELVPPIWGWLGSAAPFALELGFTPAPGLRRFWTSTPPVLSLSAIEPALDLILEAGIDRLRMKSRRQTEYLIDLAERRLAPLGFALGSPRQAERRGSHVALRHAEAYRINRALIEPAASPLRVIPDFREPDTIRLGIAPLYTSFEEICRAVARLQEVVEEREYEGHSLDRAPVT